jgi:hypothetical protein
MVTCVHVTDIADLEDAILEGESIGCATPLFEGMKHSFFRLRETLQAIDGALQDYRAPAGSQDFLDAPADYSDVQSALLQVALLPRSCLHRCFDRALDLFVMAGTGSAR